MGLTLTINVAQNGYTLEYCDPEVQASNREPDSDYEDPYKTLLFKTPEEVQSAVGKLVPLLLKMKEADDAEDASEDSLSSMFQQAVKELSK